MRARTPAAGAPAREKLRILFVEDSPADVELCLAELRHAGLDVDADVVETPEQLQARAREAAYDVVLSDYNLGGWTGLDALDALRALGLDTPVILVTGSLGDEAAVECLKRGVEDYVTKDRLARLPTAIRRAVERHALRGREAAAIAELRGREEHLSQLMDNIHEAYHLFSADGSRTLYVSPAYETVFGRPSRELYDDPLAFVNAIHPDDRGHLLAELEKVRRGEEGAPVELRVVRPDGQERWILARGVPVRDAEGVVRRIAGVALDITDRKRAQETLHREQYLTRMLMDNIPDAIYFKDADSRFIRVNRALATMFGLDDPAQAVGKTDFDFFSPAHALAALETEREVMRTGRPVLNLEEQETWPDRPTTWASSTKMPLRNAAGTIVGTFGISRDITRNKEAERALLESEERFRSVYENTAIGLYRTTPDGRILMANPAIIRMLGYPSTEALARRNLEKEGYEPGYPRAEFRRRLESAGQVVGLESAWTRADGSRLWVRESAHLVRDADGRHLYYDGTVEDITERKQAEEAARQSEQRLRTVFDRMQLIGLELDTADRIVYCNDYFLSLTGWRREEVLGADYLAAFLPPESPARGVFARTMAQGDAQTHFRNPILTRGRELRDIAWNNTLLREESGRITGVVSIGEDVTDRERAVAQLQRSEADHRSLVEHAPLGIYRATRAGRFLTVNPALVSMLGYDTAEEVLALDIPRDVYSDPAEREGLLSKPVAVADVTWRRRDGKHIAVRISSRVLPGETVEGAHNEGLVEDVTEQRSLEQQFRQAQRLEAVGRLAGGVAHDFNNVLTAITGYTGLLLEDLPAGDPKRADLEEIRTAAQRAAALTRQLLAFSRKQVLQTRVLDLNTSVQAVERMLRRLIGEDVKLEMALGRGLGAVRADPGQIEQVMLNLAVNARDAMPNGGRLTLETANAEFDESYVRQHAGAMLGRHVMLAVSDTGIGMDAETQSRIFEPFFTTKEAGKGTGLGLATVYGIVKQSGGYIWVYSEPGRGTTFKIYLPRVDEPVEAPGRDSAPQPPVGGHETVLLAEDDASVRAVVTETLLQRGYGVLRAPDGQTALELARAHAGAIDLLVTDLVMPGMTGRELATALAAERPGLPVLFMSGYTDDAVVRHGVLEEGHPYLQKPFTPDALSLKVREVLDRSRGSTRG